MGGEDPAGDRRGIGVVAKQDFARRGDILEADLSLLVDQIVRRSRYVVVREQSGVA